jgi:uncharacterized LabA/DUF88 family protein
MRTYIYIDGFNLYYRALKNTPFKWLDLKLLSEKLLSSENDILKIKYFTARATGVFDPRTPIRQKTYIRALKAYIPEVEIRYGRFSTHNVRMLQFPITNPKKFCTVVKTEEKGSDVNLAVHIINDYWQDKYDCAVIISNDSDLAEPLRLIRERNDKVIGLICPFAKGNPSRELRKHVNFVKKIRTGVLKVSQLPTNIPGTQIHKPASWQNK